MGGNFSGGVVETEDLAGSSDIFAGTVGLSNTNLPSVAAGIISEFNIENMETNSQNEVLFVSFNGTDFKALQRGDSWTWTPKGNLTQIIIKGSSASVNYEAVLNRELT
jgi:hypothetical protein